VVRGVRSMESAAKEVSRASLLMAAAQVGSVRGEIESYTSMSGVSCNGQRQMTCNAHML
jgi:hypothetical protein